MNDNSVSQPYDGFMETNSPDLWRHLLPVPRPDGHKYDRGHAVILGANELTGATRLCTSACSRMGAGLVSVLAEERADLYRSCLEPDIMVTAADNTRLKKVSVMLAGCGGVSASQKAFALDNPFDCDRVLDANAIPMDGDFSTLDERTILTPHEGEFSKAFPDLTGRMSQQALEAAKRSNCIVVLKGAETVIAAPDGKWVINRHASPWLAKAGTGDVLAGMIAGLVCQHMPLFEAACAAVWLHGEAGKRIGPGLIAGDINGQIPALLSEYLPAA